MEVIEKDIGSPCKLSPSGKIMSLEKSAQELIWELERMCLSQKENDHLAFIQGVRVGLGLASRELQSE